MSEDKKDVCLNCFGAKEVEVRPDVFEDCLECQKNPIGMNIRPMPSRLKTKYRMWCLGKKISMKDATIALVKYAMEHDLDLVIGE